MKRAKCSSTSLSWPTAVICYDGGMFIGDAPDILYLQRYRRRRQGRRAQGRLHGLRPQERAGLAQHVPLGARSQDLRPNQQQWRKDYAARQARATATRSAAAAISASIPRRSRSRRSRAAGSTACRSIVGATDSSARTAITCRRSCSKSGTWRGIRISRSFRLGGRLRPMARRRRSIASARWKRGAIARTKLRVAGMVPGPIEGGGRAAGYFTGSTGVRFTKVVCGRTTTMRSRSSPTSAAI